MNDRIGQHSITRRLMLLSSGAAFVAIACSDSDTVTTEDDSAGGNQNTGGSLATTTTQGVGGAGGAAGACGMAMLVMGSNYGIDPHDLMIPLEDLQAGVDKSYTSSPGGGGHTHVVSLTAADFAALNAGETVTKYTCRTPASQIDHEWAISCADPNIQPVLEGEFGTEGNCPA